MPSWPPTRLTLLNRIRNPRDQEAWDEFVALYGPLVYGFIRKRVPQDADAADMMQEVLSAIARGTYDHRRGPFHKWLLTVTLNELRDFFARRNHEISIVASSDLEEHPSKVEEEWEQAHKQRLFDRAAELVRAETNPVHWQAFWLTAVEDKTGKEVASILRLTISNIFSVKSRIMARIRELVQQMQED